jgi:hypothetical protein
MRFLYKKEREDQEFDWAARSILDGVSEGLSESEAAARAGVGADELRTWRRDAHFRAAVKRARTEDRVPKIWVLSDEPEDPGHIPPPGTSQSPSGSILGPQMGPRW